VNNQSSKYTTVEYEDRIDLIALRSLGDPGRYQEILDLNPDLDILHPQAEKVIEVPSE